MNSRTLRSVITLFFSFLFCVTTQAQSFGINASAAWITNCSANDYYNTSGSGSNQIGAAGLVFNNANLGAYTQNSEALVLRGGEIRSFKTPGVANVCSAHMYYRVYAQSGVPGSFTAMDLAFTDDCNVPAGTYPSGGSCVAGDQKWSRVVQDGVTTPYAPVNLTAYAPGNYVLEIYYDVTGSGSSTSLCNETITLNNGGANYKAFFSIQAPELASYNPTTCNGTEGFITIKGLVPGVTYTISYSDDGVAVGPLNLTANAAGEVNISGLNAGTYSDFTITSSGCNTDLNTGVILSNPLFTPKFNKIAPFCAGSTAPVLPTTSTNGISGTWNPAVINNQNSGTYTFTPNAGQCGLPTTMTVTVNPKVTPTFSFGTSLTICAGGTVPALPNTSTNGISGTWSPAVVDNQNSGTYTFTPNAGQCANPTTFTVTVTPNIPPTFAFGSSLTICAGQAVPALPTTSDNGITGSWSPATVDNQNSGVYAFTPTAGQCATTATFTVTVNPNVTPSFPFGTSLNICAGGTIPALPGTSDNSITGTWSPATVDNQNSATYTFTPTAGQCAVNTTFTVTVAPNIPPSFSFGSSLTICAGGAVPALPTTSDNGITGNWNPAVVDNQASAVYTFTPGAGQCATTTTFTVTVNPNITPAFSFGTSLTICAGAAVPALPATSDNGITGSWSPATVDNQNSGIYTFTPSAEQCAVTTTFTVTVNPNVTPTFSFGTSLNICAGGTVPALPATSQEGIMGTWSPATVDNNASGTYTFTPAAGQCAVNTSFSVTVAPNIPPSFAFGSSLTICAGGTVPALPATSDNGINGTWNPAVVDDQNSATYTFTPTAGQCATTASFAVTVNPIVTPAFAFGTTLSICAGGSVPVLPGTSANGITGTWSPATVDNQNSATYTFTPGAGQCANTTSFTVSVNSNTPPVFSFGNSLTICAGGSVPTLPGTSDNGIAGTWNPATVDNQASATYTFTPAAGQCATAATFTVTVNPNITPLFAFGTSLSVCAGGTVPALPGTSDNGINGTWSPATVDNNASGTYTFTPATGQCAVSATFTVTVNPNVTPTFSFGTSLTVCEGGTVPALPTSSDNGINGTWSPATVDNQVSGSYVFTPAAGQCATTTSFEVTVSPNTIPIFSIGSSLTICAGASVPTLPTTSDNGVAGTWSPATVDNQASGTYTFTPSAGQCAITATFTVTVNPNITPSFAFGTSMTICAGSGAPSLPAVSDNGITGSWNPATADDQNSATYTFTPAAGQCAVATTFTLTVKPNVAPSFAFGATMTICAGSGGPVLPTTSDNGITGTWNPAVVDDQNTATYTFTPAAGQCASGNATFTLNVTPITIPTFAFGTSMTICTGSSVPVLPATSDNGLNGSWSPATVSNQASAIYTFTPVNVPGKCISTVKFNVTVNPILTPTFDFGTAQVICSGSTVPVLPTTSNNGIKGVWSPAVVSNQASAVYTFTTDAGQCAAPNATFTVTIPPVATVNTVKDTTVNDGDMLPVYTVAGTPSAGVTYTWTNSNPSIGLAATGTGNIPAFTANNKGNTPIRSTITITPSIGGCAGTPETYEITVNPLDKDVFVPNVFSPNGDGRNDKLFVYGNYISQVDMHIFNQWGQEIFIIDSKTKGWDGTYKGKPQPVGVYVYAMKVVMTDGRTISTKGSITLVR
jgi:gliding motility-associated-like protein